MSDAQKGVVKWFNDAKGFGFIEHPSGKDVFVHYSVIQTDGFKTLKDGEPVEYEIQEGPKGLHAAKVVRVSKPEIVVEAIGGDGSSGSDSGDEASDDDDSEADSHGIAPSEESSQQSTHPDAN